MMNASNSLQLDPEVECNGAKKEGIQDMEQLICGICRSILIYPVTLPCGHHLCLDCFKKTVEMVSLLCPFCRLRISCWARKAKSEDNLIDWSKWNVIQTKFPDLVRMKTSGDETSDHMESQIYDFRPIDRMISSPGEIHQEFEEFSRKEKQRVLEEEEATQQLIQKLLNEDKISEENQQKLLEETANDEEIARSLQQSQANSKVTKTLRNRNYFFE